MFKKNVEDLRELIMLQGANGNWNASPYMTGLYNGMELALAIIEDREPIFRDCIDNPLKNKEIHPTVSDQYIDGSKNILIDDELCLR